MRLHGLDALALSITLAVSGGLVLLLHLRRRPTRRLIVPTLALWRTLPTGRFRRSARVRAVAALLLALAIVAALTGALGDPRVAPAQPGRHLVIVLDHSASMAAHDVAPTRLHAARARAKALIEELGPEDQALVIALASAARVLTPFTSERARLSEVIDAVDQSDAAGDLTPAAALAADLLRARARPELVLLSDGNLARVAEARSMLAALPRVRALHERIGTSERNVAITRLSARAPALAPHEGEVLVTVTSYGREPESLTLQVHAGGRRVHEATLQVAPHASTTEVFRLATPAGLLEASIRLERGLDALPSDDRARAVVPAHRRLRVLAVSADDRYLEAALRLESYLDVTQVTPDAYETVRPEDFDVLVFDGTLPARAPTGPALYLGPALRAGAFPLARGALRQRPFFERVSDHALVRGLALEDVNVARAVQLSLAPGDVAIAATRAGDPLLVEGERAGVPFVALAFDVRESDLPLRPAFPLLILRALERLVAAPPALPGALLAGEPAALPLTHPEDEGALIAPDGTRRKLPRGQPEARLVCDRAGTYTLVSGSDRVPVAVNVPAEQEGAIAPRTIALARARGAAAPTRAGSADRLWPWLVLVALGLLALEWLSFHRRWTA